MASNNGQRLLVFGLSFAQHDNRKMQQVLRHYSRLPDAPGNRAALFVELTKLGKELENNEQTQTAAELIADWLRVGGDFPLGDAPNPINAADRLRPAEGHYPQPHHQFEAPGMLQPARELRRPWAIQTTENHWHDRRFGPGHTLADFEDGPGENSISPSGAPQNGLEDGEDAAMVDVDGGMNLDANNNNHAEDLEPLDHDFPDFPHNDGNLQPSDGAFHGPGRTFDDIDESAAVTDVTDAATTMPVDVNTAPDIPQLRGEQQWRGNNVHGFQGFGGMPHPGLMGHMPHRVMPGHMDPFLGHGQPGLARNRRRPRMEHDLEDEDEAEDLDDAWGIAPGRFGLGPGRTLNDPEPAQDAGLPDQQPTFQEPESDDDVGEDDIAVAEDETGEPVECPICLEDYPPSGFPKVATVTSQCDHPDKACLQCLDSSITSIVETGALHLLACPICPQKLTRWNVKEYATKKIYERYKYLKQQASIPGHYISCTNSNCGGSQAHDSNGPTGPMMVCKFCQVQTCAKHRRPWHDGQTCAEYDMDPVQMERLEEEEATAKLLAKEDTSICPKCGQGVTKTDGCDHMSCQCGTEWCYVCSASYENILRLGATAHATFCIYHPNKVNLTKAQQEAARARIMGLVHGGEVSPELTRARDEFRQRRREEMRPKLAEAAEARMKQAAEEQKRQRLLSRGVNGSGQVGTKRKVKLVPAWEEGGTTKRSL